MSPETRLRCAIGCDPFRNPVTGFANLKGNPGSVCENYAGVYPLCAHHAREAHGGNWHNVTIIGWEELPIGVVR